VPDLPEQFMDAMNGNKELAGNIKSSILKAIEIARGSNAEYMGLGAFTSVFTKAGYDLEKMNLGPLTSGNSATACTIYKGVIDACRVMGINPGKAVVGIIGATGSVGQPTTMMLARKFKKVIITAKDAKKLEEFRKDLVSKNTKAEIYIENDINQTITNSDVIVFAVSATKREIIINPDLFKPGSICCDASRPLIIPEFFIEQRKDVLFMEGAILKGPWFISCPTLLRMGGDNYGFGCLVETIVRALEGEEKSGGYGIRVTVEEAERMYDLLFRKYKFKLAGYRMYDRQYSISHLILKRIYSLKKKIALK
jgi:predicted amino acid dehydrogenase